jgi:hypothetical protein
MHRVEVDRRLQHPVDVADDREPALEGERTQALGEHRAAHAIHRKLHPVSARPARLLVEVRLARADRHVEAKGLEALELGGRSRSADDLRAQRLARLQRRHPHARGHPGDEQPLARLQPPLRHQHVVHYGEDERNRGRLLERQVHRDRQRFAPVHEHVLGKRAGGAAHHPLTCAHHLAGGFLPGGLGGAGGHQAMAGDELAAIQPCGAHAHQDLVAARLRHRRLAQIQDGLIALRFQEIGSHCALMPASFTTLPHVRYSLSM